MTLLCRKWLASFFTVIPLSVILPSHYCWWYSGLMIVTYAETKMNFSCYVAVGPSDFLLCFSLSSCVSHFSPHGLFPLLPPCFSFFLIPVFLAFYSYWCDRILFGMSSRQKKEFVLTHSSRVQVILIQESRRQELKAIGHVISTIKKETAVNSSAQFTFSFS